MKEIENNNMNAACYATYFVKSIKKMCIFMEYFKNKHHDY